MEKLSRDEMYVLGLTLEPKALLTFCQTDKKFNEKVCKNDNFWREKLRKDYPLLEKFNYKKDAWKKFYLKMIYYISKLEEDFGVPYFPLKNYSPEDLHLFRGSSNFQNQIMKYAAGVGNIDLIEKMLKQRASELTSAISAAAEEGHLETVKFLIKKGALPKQAALTASYNGHINIIKYLIKKNYPIDKELIMIEATIGGYRDIVEYLIEQGEKNFDTALLYSAEGGHIDILKLLIQNGARNFNDALLRASSNGHLDIVKYLVELGEVYDLDKALRYSAFANHIDIVKYLIGKGAKPSLKLIDDIEDPEMSEYLKSKI
jgi:hypothetical protein